MTRYRPQKIRMEFLLLAVLGVLILPFVLFPQLWDFLVQQILLNHQRAVWGAVSTAYSFLALAFLFFFYIGSYLTLSMSILLVVLEIIRRPNWMPENLDQLHRNIWNIWNIYMNMVIGFFVAVIIARVLG